MNVTPLRPGYICIAFKVILARAMALIFSILIPVAVLKDYSVTLQITADRIVKRFTKKIFKKIQNHCCIQIIELNG